MTETKAFVAKVTLNFFAHMTYGWANRFLLLIHQNAVGPFGWQIIRSDCACPLFSSQVSHGQTEPHKKSARMAALGQGASQITLIGRFQ